ncbi:hypothetical protein AAL_01003 [Moelleriella libera RCEF 2490]|uniref:TAM domain methyltransferase n=1 Tax=Moelleriella libera RCEF 2490 TaxID=1081109 RepID=A0A166VDF1_9HYPO|nr:hypothetical protein AAL_01003 [Moelleriella libera RCEF 2490]
MPIALAVTYAFPNDLPEQERLDLQAHALLKLFDGRLFFSPLSTSSPPRHVLDIATGLGDWAIQMGDMFPSAEIIATDLSPIQPDAVPPNVSFYVEDSSDSWDYPHKFDYIHTRVTGGCWSSFEEQVVQQAFEALEPGGYLESQEIDSSLGCDDGTLDQNGALMRWASDITTAGERCDRSTLIGQTLKDAYERVGFVDVQEIVFRIPVNGWPRDRHLREIGAMWEANLVSGLSGLSLSLFHRAFDRSPAETEVFLVDVRREVSNPNVHAWMPCYVVWGRKPLMGETGG